jgi:hypothetical protein
MPHVALAMTHDRNAEAGSASCWALLRAAFFCRGLEVVVPVRVVIDKVSRSALGAWLCTVRSGILDDAFGIAAQVRRAGAGRANGYSEFSSFCTGRLRNARTRGMQNRGRLVACGRKLDGPWWTGRRVRLSLPDDRRIRSRWLISESKAPCFAVAECCRCSS